MQDLYPRLSRSKRDFMSAYLRAFASFHELLPADKCAILQIANLLHDVQIEVKCEISDPEYPEYQVKSNNE